MSSHDGSGHPDRLGHYRILGVLGQGGMGTVYEAEQSQPRRAVALKVMKAEIVGEDTLRRFRLESEVLGRLRHPGIAQVYEAGTFETPAGRAPFFAMERVEGTTLGEYIVQARPDRTRRLELFAAACDAVQHAHQQGVIHRDLKPANILVDQEGRPKVVDFGVARLSAADDLVTRVDTEAGQLMGTLAFMSPEQVSGDPAEVDTRSDVYALGTLLYLLLAERMPRDLKGRSLTEMITLVGREEAPRLSAALPDADGDLDAIVAKALAHDRDRRYASAGELAADVRRFLADEPITARPPTTGYQLRKLARRHRAAVLGVSFTTLAILAGFATSVVLYTREKAARTELDSSYRTTREVVEFLEGVLGRPDESGLDEDEVSLASALRRGESMLDDGMGARRPESRGWIRSILGEAFLSLGQDEAAERNLEASLATHAAAGPARIKTLTSLGMSRARRGLADEADRVTREALELARRAPGPKGQDLVDALSSRASALRMVSLHDPAREAAEELLSVADRTEGDEVLAGLNRSRALRFLGEIEVQEGRLERAEEHLEQALSAFEGTATGPDIEYSEVLGTLAVVKGFLGDPEAVELSERTIELTESIRGRLHPDSAVAWANHATLLTSVSGPRAAIPVMHRAIEIERELGGQHGAGLGNKLSNLAMLHLEAGDTREAERVAQEAVDVLEASPSGHRPQLATALSILGRLLEHRGEDERVAELHRRAFQINRELLGPRHFNTQLEATFLAKAATAVGDLDSAIEAWRTAYEGSLEEGSPVAELRTVLLANLRHALERQGSAEALAELDALPEG